MAHAVEDAPDQTQIDTDPAAGAALDFLISTGGVPLNPDYRTPLLFVWRTLHIELDSMASELDTGTSTAMTVNTLTDGAKTWDTNQFASYGEEWHLHPATSQPTTFPVAANTATVITATTQPGQSLLNGAQVGDPYEVRYEGWPHAGRPIDTRPADLLRGDIDEPLTTALDGAFRPCYVQPDQYVDDRFTPWHHKFGFSWTDEQAYLVAERSITILDNDYWGAYACGVYDTHIMDGENDFDTEVGVPAAAYPDNVISIWFEVTRDMGAQWTWTLAQLQHVREGDLPRELGHWFIPFGTAHSATSDNVMWGAGSDADENLYPTLPLMCLPEHQRNVRDTLNPRVQ